MEHKSWPWRKKSSEKIMFASNEVSSSLKGTDKEKLNSDKEAGPEQSVEASNETLSSILYDCKAKDDLLDIHAKMAEDAIAGKEKAEAEVIALRQELDEAMKLGQAANRRLTDLDGELKDCLQQLDCVRKDQDQRIQDAVAKTCREYEKAQKKLQEKFSETSKRLRNLEVESANQSMALQVKEKLIDELRISKSQSEAEFNALMDRLDSTEKENSFLRYEFRMLEKELEIRSEEREFNRKSADALQKQQLESVKKITKLELECQRMRSLLRKRLPGPAEHPSKKISVLMERLSGMEEENKTLQEKLIKKIGELEESKIMCAQLSSKLGNKSWELAKYSPASNELSLTSDYDICSDDRLFSNSGSWATALTSELEQCKPKNVQERKRLGTSDMSLMDDFVEMEKLAIVSVDIPLEINLTGKEIVPVPQGQSTYSNSQQKIMGRNVSTNKAHDWLQDVLKAILEENRVSKRSVSELLEDVRIALLYMNNPRTKIVEKAATTAEPADSEEKVSYLTLTTAWEGENGMTQMQETQSNFLEENSRLKNELKILETAKKELEESLDSAANRTEALVNQLRESEQIVEKLQIELEILKASKGMIEDQFENQKSINEDLDTQLAVARVKLNQALQKFLSLEAELENKSTCCEELEAACLELQLQLESAAKKESSECNPDLEEKQMQTGCELTTASVKLAECQETILNLGKQLKALSSPRETVLFDKVFSTTTNTKNLTKRSLLDQMLAEDESKADMQKSVDTRNLTKNGEKHSSALILFDDHNDSPAPIFKEPPQGYFSSYQRSSSTGIGALAIVPSKKKRGGGGFLRKLLVRRKRWSSKNTSLTFGKV